MPSSTFTLNARIAGGRWQHHRVRDHFGSESDLSVSLEGPVGPWLQGTPIHYVILDLWTRLLALESTNHSVGHFTMDAVIGMHFTLYALLHGSVSGSFTLKSWLVGGRTFSINANIRGQYTFSLDAVIV